MSLHASRLGSLRSRIGFAFLPRLGHCFKQQIPSNCLGQGHWSKRKEYLRASQLAAAAEARQASESDWDINTAGSSKEGWQRSDLHVVLVQPQIPQNAGNVSRTCAATSVALHLVGPLGFEIESKKLKRAGLDYWDYVCVAVHPSWDDFYAAFQQLPGPKRLIAFSKFARQHYAEEGMYRPGESTWLMFGSETSGLPMELEFCPYPAAGPAQAHEAAMSNGAVVKIPMIERHVRSLNLATSVGIGLYEALRQLDGAVLPEAQQIDSMAPWSDYNAV